jgi:hypothetical protein
MSGTRSAALRVYEAQEEDNPMAAPKPLKLSGAERILRSPHIRKPTRDFASLGLPSHIPVKMSLTEALMLDRGEGRLER